MSIRDEINARIAEGRLFRLEPINVKDPRKRTVLMSEEINKMVSGPWPDGPMGSRCGFLRADLENVVTGDFITVCWEPFKGRNEQIGRLDPVTDEVWDLRCQDPPPGLRVFCRFAEKNVLVALTCSPRSKPVPWLHRLPLLDRFSPEWKRAIAESLCLWKELFPDCEPVSGTDINAYLSDAIL
jgi:hypothetical protein